MAQHHFTIEGFVRRTVQMPDDDAPRGARGLWKHEQWNAEDAPLARQAAAQGNVPAALVTPAPQVALGESKGFHLVVHAGTTDEPR